jgi:hydroxyacylglutathione hydrolase
MEIKQFEDKNLAHFSYAIESHGEIALVDPSRDPGPYFAYAKHKNAKITVVIETHPHADFVSSHLEIGQATGATVFVSKLLGAEYPHQTFDDDDAIVLGNITLKSLNTPGHSPDSISIVAIDQNGMAKAVFTGDTLFIGDCGRPDLREEAGAIKASRNELAKKMYYSLRNKLMVLPDDVIVYPAHGSGSLCGKALSDATSSTIGQEKKTNWSLQNMTESEFVEELLADQPFVPKYFPFDVGLNKKGAGSFKTCIANVPRRAPVTCKGCAASLDPSVLIIDTRPEDRFKQGHLKNAINLMGETKFETWLGSIVNPGEKFYLVAGNEQALDEIIKRVAKIGYESQIHLAFISDYGNDEMEVFDPETLKKNESAFTIVDIRNESETKNEKVFTHTLNIPLYELRERIGEIPLDKPVLVHCAGGFRSAAGSSILHAELRGKVRVFDLGEAIRDFRCEETASSL